TASPTRSGPPSPWRWSTTPPTGPTTSSLPRSNSLQRPPARRPQRPALRRAERAAEKAEGRAMADEAFTGLRSPRLLLRRLHPSAISDLCRYRSLPEVARYQSWAAFSRADGERLVAGQEGLHPDTPGTWFQLALVVAESGDMAGDCGLHFRSDDP